MNLFPLKPRKALNKAYLKVKPNRSAIEVFKTNLIQLIDQTNDTESEEFHKNLVSDFLKKTWYDPNHYINTKGRNDLVIHTGKDAKSTVGVIIEAKKPTNKSEMLKVDNINTKAFHELVLYFLRERITQNNLDLKYLVATNIHQWFVFDAALFEKLFAQNKDLVKQFNDFEAGRLSGKTTDFFYKEIAEPFIAQTLQKFKNLEELTFTHFDLHDYEKPLRNDNKQDDNKLIALFKLFSPEHLLKLPFANDSNSLDKKFYSELLHIIGLSEVKEGGKKIIDRNKAGERNSGSLLENAITQLDSLDKIGRLEKPSQYGATQPERLFNVGLELCITWINRILFLKLLEAQLITYHKGDKAYSFLNYAKIHNYDDLNKLFFQVLARRHDERNEEIQKDFSYVPYLNSSLFEMTDMEHITLSIGNLDNDKKIPILSGTVLKDDNGKKRSGELNALQYLFEFLEAYDFSSEGAEDIQEDNKTLINASVLGLIFEKINGYKDGSFFTPGFITMYMCRETIRRAVLQKFKENKGWDCQDLNELYDKIENRQEANDLVNSIKICDPAVGSGHFLVSALNEIIAIKNDLKILQDRNGKRLKEYHIEVVNDELIVTDDDGELYEYHYLNKESQRVQETLFHEKQTIIENCLFGVDINPNSVKICRLRLWIELLKSAYYKSSSASLQGTATSNGSEELETLPNIDINIKCGNSLISRFDLDADIKTALKKSKWNVETYRSAVDSYRNAKSKEEKRNLERLIESIKSDFRSEISKNDPKLKKLYKLAGELTNLTTQQSIFGMSDKEKKEWTKQVEKLSKEQKGLETEIEEIKNNKIYENAFEWRFEFPEVLDDNGDFVGFDVVIGNPPYIRQEEFKEIKTYLAAKFEVYSGTADLYVYFVERSFQLLKEFGKFTFIMPNKWMQAGYGKSLRSFFVKNRLEQLIDFGDLQVFEEATTYPCIIIAAKERVEIFFSFAKIHDINAEGFKKHVQQVSYDFNCENLSDETWIITNTHELGLIEKTKNKAVKLEAFISNSYRGILTGLSEAFVIDKETKERILEEDPNSEELIKPFLMGRNVKPYGTSENTHFLILIPKGFTIKRNLKPDNPNYVAESPPRYGEMEYNDAWNWFIENYPGVANHLIGFKAKAEKRTDKGDFWWELRACDYYEMFEKPKIMYQVFQVKPCFIYDTNGLYCNNSMWIIPIDDKVILAILNSKIGWWLISKYCTQIQNGYQLIWKYFSQIPIANADENQSQGITAKVNKILTLKKTDPNADTSALEAEIDKLVYELYGLTEEEIEIIEKSIN